MFPDVSLQTVETVILKSYFLGLYLGMTTVDNHPSMITKTLDDKNDPELRFLSYYYKTAEATETKLILLCHEASGTFFRMTGDKRLEVQSKEEMENLVDLPVHPSNITKADNRFFYLKNAAFEGTSYYVLEAMNGNDYGYVLVVKDEGKPPELQYTSDRKEFPIEAYIDIQDPNEYHD